MREEMPKIVIKSLKPSKATPEQRKDVIQLYKQYMGIRSIALIEGIGTREIRKILREEGILRLPNLQGEQ